MMLPSDKWLEMVIESQGACQSGDESISDMAINHAATAINRLKYEIGLLKLDLSHKKTLLTSCEKALEERDSGKYLV